MKHNIWMSLVIIAYNNDEHIEECIRSCICNTDESTEILVVDDASTDSTERICRSFHTQIKYIKHTTNKSAFESRRSGLNQANGEYIWFIDGDDSISIDAVAEIKKEILANQPDMICFGCTEVDGTSIRNDNYINSQLKNANQVIVVDKFNWILNYNHVPWSRVTRKNILKKCYSLFPNENYLSCANDLPIFTLAKIFSSHVSIVNKQLYIHNILNHTSSTPKSDENIEKHFNSRFNSWRMLENVIFEQLSLYQERRLEFLEKFKKNIFGFKSKLVNTPRRNEIFFEQVDTRVFIPLYKEKLSKSNPLENITDYDIFDERWYYNQYKDVANSGVSPKVHFQKYGSFLRRNPCKGFSPRFYEKKYRDVIAMRVDPFSHYILIGHAEGRDTSEGHLLDMSEISNKYIIAKREDGFGERLKAIINAKHLSIKTGIPFKFHWSNRLENNQFHSITEKDRIFSKNFIQEYHVDINNTKHIPLSIDTPFCEDTSLNANYNGWDVHQNYFTNSKNIKLIPSKSDYRVAFEKIDFCLEIRRIIDLANKVNLDNDIIGIHIRSGDIVFGDFKYSEKFTTKAIPALLAKEIIKRSENKFIIFSQDRNINNFFLDIDNATFINSLVPSEIKDNFHRDFFEIILMSRCSKIICSSSGFAVLASRIGRANTESIESYLSKNLQIDIIKTYADNNSFPNTLELHNSYACLYAISIIRQSNNNNEFEKEVISLCRKAILIDPENHYFHLKLIELSKIEETTELEKLAKEIIEGKRHIKNRPLRLILRSFSTKIGDFYEHNLESLYKSSVNFSDSPNLFCLLNIYESQRHHGKSKFEVTEHFISHKIDNTILNNFINRKAY